MIGEQVTWPTQQWSTHPCVRIKRAGVSNSHSAPTEVSRDSSSSPGGLILTETSDGPTKPDQELTRRHAFCLHLSPLLFVTFPSSQVKCYSPNEPYSILQCRAMAPRRYAVPPGSSTPAANDTPYDRTWVILSALLSTCSAGEFSRRPCAPLSAALLMPARPLAFSLLTRGRGAWTGRPLDLRKRVFAISATCHCSKPPVCREISRIATDIPGLRADTET